MDWIGDQVVSGAHPELKSYAGVVGVDHYFTNQGVPCINGVPHEFKNQDDLSQRWKGNFSGIRFMTYRILDAVPYDMAVQNKIVESPDYFLRCEMA